MKPEYAAAVYPIINFVLKKEQKLIDKYDSPENVAESDVRKIQEEIKTQIDNRGADLEGRDEWDNYAKFALVAWIDSVMIANPFFGHHWRDLILEVRYFRTGGAAEDEFFKKCEKAKRREYKNAVEVFFLCFCLGFRGVYNSPSAVSGFRELPKSAKDWQRNIAKIVIANLSKTKLTPKPIYKFDNSPREGYRQFIAALTVFLALAGVLAVTIFAISQSGN